MNKLTAKYPLVFKAAILERNNEPLRVDKVEFKGPLEAGQVLVRIHFSGICGKQIEEIMGTAGFDRYLPHMLGHEGSGEVIDTGPGVKKIKAGDRVVLHWLKGSGIDAVTPIYTCAGKRINAGWITTFNEFGVISENRVTKVPHNSDLAVACLLGCAVTTGVGVILNEAKVQSGDSVAVFGCGGVGLNVIQGAALVGAYPIIAVDKSAECLNMALRFGATHVIEGNSKNIVGEAHKITDNKGAKFVIIAAGDQQLIELAVETSSAPGAVFIVGVPPVGSRISVDPLKIHRRMMLTGSYGGGAFPDRDIPAYLDKYNKGYLKLKELIFNMVSLDNINEGITSLLSGKAGRCIINMVDKDAS